MSFDSSSLLGVPEDNAGGSSSEEQDKVLATLKDTDPHLRGGGGNPMNPTPRISKSLTLQKNRLDSPVDFKIIIIVVVVIITCDYILCFNK